MKLIYSELQKFLPDLNIEPQKLRDDLTMIGHFCNFYEKIDDQIVFDLDIKVNRGDCLGYYGIARDLSVLYHLDLSSTDYQCPSSNYQLPIAISTSNVTRVMAAKIVHLKSGPSPSWLQSFLKLHGVNSINTLVDLTNYIMFLYGIPCHAFDTAKSTDHLIWEMNPKYTEFTSLDKTVLKVDPSVLMINSPNRALSLSFWGGEFCAINNSTTDTIVELAVYHPTTVRQNSRLLKATTEASIRLEKSLDPNLIPQAFQHLLKLIFENCGGLIGSQVFDYYPNPKDIQPIDYDFNYPSLYSGIEISPDFGINCLTKLGCLITDNQVTPPSIRKDLNISEDLTEEIVRFYGYQNIPTNQPLAFKEVQNITPPVLYLIDSLKDQLVDLGYDEVLSWPLTKLPINPETAIYTQNSINSEYPVLRQSIIQSLQNQLDQYSRFKLPTPQFFEIGKIYFKKDNLYQEHYSLGIYHPSSNQLENDLKKLNLTATITNNFAEIILDNLEFPPTYIPQHLATQAIELNSQIITLDANISLDQPQDPLTLINQYQNLIDPKILWSISIIDIYQNRYTFRVNYYNCDDKTAKKIHLAVFKLEC